jgi:hypothetical protein
MDTFLLLRFGRRVLSRYVPISEWPEKQPLRKETKKILGL